MHLQKSAPAPLLIRSGVMRLSSSSLKSKGAGEALHDLVRALAISPPTAKRSTDSLSFDTWINSDNLRSLVGTFSAESMANSRERLFWDCSCGIPPRHRGAMSPCAATYRKS